MSTQQIDKTATEVMQKQDAHKNFVDLVERMRQAQVDYFAHRMPESLRLSRQLEQQVDSYIHSQKNLSLFS